MPLCEALNLLHKPLLYREVHQILLLAKAKLVGSACVGGGEVGNRFARDDKEPGPSWGKQLPGERPRETAET